MSRCRETSRTPSEFFSSSSEARTASRMLCFMVAVFIFLSFSSRDHPRATVIAESKPPRPSCLASLTPVPHLINLPRVARMTRKKVASGKKIEKSLETHFALLTSNFSFLHCPVDALSYITLFVLAYLLGSIPTGFLVAKARGVDIRSVGSGNIGATNVMRVLGRTAGSLVLVADGQGLGRGGRVAGSGVPPF